MNKTSLHSKRYDKITSYTEDMVENIFGILALNIAPIALILTVRINKKTIALMILFYILVDIIICLPLIVKMKKKFKKEIGQLSFSENKVFQSFIFKNIKLYLLVSLVATSLLRITVFDIYSSIVCGIGACVMGIGFYRGLSDN